MFQLNSSCNFYADTVSSPCAIPNYSLEKILATKVKMDGVCMKLCMLITCGQPET